MTDEEKDRSTAITDRREQVAAMPRPEKLSSVDIKETVAAVRETEDLHKVYVWEWITLFTSVANSDDGKAECEAQFLEKYDGRVEDDHWRIMPTSTSQPDSWPWKLQLFKPNVRGEFKHRADAERYRDEQVAAGKEAEVVVRNSRDEFRLRDYGIKKLIKKS